MTKTKEITDEEYEQEVIDWTQLNPETMVDHITVKGTQLCKDIELYMEAITKRHKDDDQINSLNLKIQELIFNHADLVHGIQMWWKYSQETE